MIEMSKICILCLLSVSSVFISGCSQKPEGTLSEKKMVDLMADMQLAEAYSDMEYMGSESFEKREALAKSVLAEHGVTQAELDSTLSWYGRNLDEYSELFEKVNKEIERKRRKFIKSDSYDESDQGDMLWPYGKNGLVSGLGNSGGWIFSVDEPGLLEGDMVEWKMHFNKAAQFTGVLGVDYTDGTSESVTNVSSGRVSIELRLQTDTSKNVSRLYGTMRMKERAMMPVFADSISLRKMPFDSLEFRKYRNQKQYGIPVRIKPRKEEKNDSVPEDTDMPGDSLVRINIATGEIRQNKGSLGHELIRRSDPGVTTPPRGSGKPMRRIDKSSDIVRQNNKK